MIRRLLFLLVVFGFVNELPAQTNEIGWEYNYKHFGMENGLPSSETYQVHQDRSGLLWILTDRGVVRYDGFETHRYTTQNGLCDNVNFRIHEDPNGGVWFVGFNGMLSVFKDGVMQPYKYNHVISNAITIGRNAYIELDVEKDNSITYSLYSLGIILRIDKDGRITDLSSHSNGRTDFFATNDRLICFKVSQFKDSHPSVYIFKKNKERIFAGELRTIGTTRSKKHKGFHFLLTDSKLYYYNSKRFELLIDGREAISLDTDNKFLYVGFYKGGMTKYRFNPNTRKLVFVKHYLPNYSVSSTCIDIDQKLWMTTLEKGVFSIADEAFSQLAVNGEILSEEVRFINGNKDKIIITQYVGKWQQLYHPYLSKDVGKIVRRLNLVPINNGFAFQRGFINWSDWKDVDASYRANPLYSENSFVVGLNHVEIIETDGRKTYCIGLAPARKTKLSRAYNWFYIFEHKKAFIVYDTGLKVFDIRNSSVAGNYRAVLDKPIRKMCHNSSWGLVVVTASSGLFEIDMTNDAAKQLASKIPLGKQILDIFFDEQDRLWVATEKGLFLLVKRNGQVICRKFINRKLLSSAEVLSMYSFNNVVYLATKFGVQKIDFFRVKKQDTGCPVELFSVRAFAQNKESADEHLFSSKTDLIKISLSNKNLSGNLEYRYRFGADQTWVRSDKGEIILNNPSAGEYSLEVSSLDMFNKWTSPKRIGSFTVEKIVFLRWYFILLYIVLLILLFYGVLKYSVRISNRKNELLNRMMELERMALSAQMNPHFIFNSLNSIHSFLLYEENENAEKYLLRFAKLIRQTLANSRANYITIGEEYETLKNYILLENMRFRNAFTFQIDCNFNELPLDPCIPPMLIQPYVENAIIHGLPKRKEGAELLIRFFKDGGYLKVMIRDNGIGYRESKRTKRDTGHKSYGTQITEERLKSLQETSKEGFGISIEDTDESNPEFPGTTVILTIPIPTN